MGSCNLRVESAESLAPTRALAKPCAIAFAQLGAKVVISGKSEGPVAEMLRKDQENRRQTGIGE